MVDFIMHKPFLSAMGHKFEILAYPIRNWLEIRALRSCPCDTNFVMQ